MMSVGTVANVALFDPARGAPSAIRSEQLESGIRSHRAWDARSRYYHQQLRRVFQTHIPPGSRVLEIGCGIGDLLADLRPSCGVGVEFSPALVDCARRAHPELDFCLASEDRLEFSEQFDYIVLANSIGSLKDIQSVLGRLRSACGPHTRVVIAYFNALWEPILNLATLLGLRREAKGLNWLSVQDVRSLCGLSGFDITRETTEILIPKGIPLLSTLVNRVLARLWPLTCVNLVTVFVARAVMPPEKADRLTVSVIIPTRDERGNIRDAVERTPDMGAHTELIFVDGGSTDGTVAEIETLRAAHPERDIKLIHQGSGHGKGDAVRKGFAVARGDVLMILDSDLTVAPEDMPKFFEVIASGQAEFVNGSRLVYPMEAQAMRFLNKCANRFFGILFSWLLNLRIRDTLCGSKALLRRNYQTIARNRHYFGESDPFGDFDLIFGAAKAGLKFIEVPVRYGARRYGQIKIRRFRDGFLLLRMSLVALRKLKMY
ncbi:MAG TPA: glycosyltransferase [Phycisphaerae bacterium]|nr:glycosyltransferase [Phycisphaerae bacterium]HSA28318.1 glycosyltransferase [Phycisphaerae bacterium]